MGCGRRLGNWQLMASYTYSRTEGTVSEGMATLYLDNPRQAQFYEGFLPNDRKNEGLFGVKMAARIGALDVIDRLPFELQARLEADEFFADIPVIGPPEELVKQCKKLDIHEAIIAMPSAQNVSMSEPA